MEPIFIGSAEVYCDPLHKDTVKKPIYLLYTSAPLGSPLFKIQEFEAVAGFAYDSSRAIVRVATRTMLSHPIGSSVAISAVSCAPNCENFVMPVVLEVAGYLHKKGYKVCFALENTQLERNIAFILCRQFGFKPLLGLPLYIRLPDPPLAFLEGDAKKRWFGDELRKNLLAEDAEKACYPPKVCSVVLKHFRTVQLTAGNQKYMRAFMDISVKRAGETEEKPFAGVYLSESTPYVKRIASWFMPERSNIVFLVGITQKAVENSLSLGFSYADIASILAQAARRFTIEQGAVYADVRSAEGTDNNYSAEIRDRMRFAFSQCSDWKQAGTAGLFVVKP